jgi:thiol-disulfide isomerase/thioredoxin
VKTLRIPLILCLGLLCVMTLGTDGARAQSRRLALAPGDLAPEMRGYLTDDEPVALDFTAHPVTLVNFWAIWCEPCKEEMPRLEQLHRERAGDGLEIIGVLRSDDSDGETLRAHLDELGITYRVVRPRPRYLSQWAGTSVLPTSFLIDADGTIRRRYVGATTEQIDALVYDLEAALEGRPLGPIVVPETPNAVSDADRPRTQDNEME